MVGGTSAGAALMGSLMPTGKGDAKKMRRGGVEVKPGLGALANTVVDTHFFVRERTQRLLNILYSQPKGFVGIGVDEDAWAEVEGKRLQVRAGQVLLVERRTDSLVVRVLEAGASVGLP